MAEAILIKKDGVVTMDKSFDYLCSTLSNGTYNLSINKKVEPRSISQNALMWLWFTCIERETGTDKIDVHDFYCKKFLRRRMYINGLEDVVVGSTSKLNTMQMKTFLDKVQADAATEFGINLPLPADQYYNDFINEYRHR
ncbi:hypothetical protein [Bacteroides sp.]|uniref:hypothetical protein n=1 Tax=Bacteroides sp. TaxID=29523 RepID=UPI00260E2ECE|nr:hypothetical protein [Bacteroides sp.]MDD3038868.1 hypothetical protein [Bacteroides sp.]